MIVVSIQMSITYIPPSFRSLLFGLIRFFELKNVPHFEQIRWTAVMAASSIKG